MPFWARLLIAISVIVLLLVIFIVSFILYKRTPPPKGCENLGPSEENCSNCKVEGCHANIYRHKKKDVNKEDKDE
jgi:hypothetical protein